MKKLFGQNLLSIYVYGSYLSITATDKSDLDIFVIFKNTISFDKIINLNTFIKNLSKNNNFIVDISFSALAHIFYEKEKYWHNNRGLLFIEDIKKRGGLIYGENVLAEVKYSKNDVKNETIKIIYSLIYNINKNISKMNLVRPKRADIKRILKFGCYIVYYLLYLRGENVDYRKSNYYIEFDKLFNFKSKAINLYNYKNNNPTTIKLLISELYMFTSEVEEYIQKNVK